MKLRSISHRQIQVLQLIADEFSTSEIADALFISKHTVKTHRKNLCSKLGVKNTAGLIRKAFEEKVLKMKSKRSHIKTRAKNITKKDLLLLLITLVCSGQIIGQAFSFSVDTSTFSLIDENTNDTLFAVHEGVTLISNTSFRLQKSINSGSIRLRANIQPELNLFDNSGNNTVEILAARGGFGGGAIILSDPEHGDTNSIKLITNFAGTRDARIITDELQINGGADLAELFTINRSGLAVKPGMLVTLNPDRPGNLVLSNKPYDRAMAGIVAGANGVKPGILMGQQGTITHGEDLVTLSGRTYVVANNSNGNIRVGDFLTSSNVSGEAMRVKNMKRARGAIIGKAMTPLNEAGGYVLVLVNLQ